MEGDDIFDTAKNSFEIRRRFHREDLDLYCCECEQPLNISGSKHDRLHFKHEPYADYCILKHGRLSPGDSEIFTNILKAKESPRHKELKNKIAERLMRTQGVDASSICVDNRFIVRDDEKRRPDVYCLYKDKHLVFEIQLSDLSLRYILDRYEFYRKHGMYLIWILDNFDIHQQSTLVRDIKYLTKYQNFFKLDETTEDFSLLCDYKIVFVTERDNEVRSNWRQRSVSMKQIKFDTQEYQIFFYDFDGNLIWAEERQKLNEANKQAEEKKKADELEAKEKKEREKRRLSAARTTVEGLIETLKKLRGRKESTYYGVIKKKLIALDDIERQILNEKLHLNNLRSDKPPVNRWIHEEKVDQEFIALLLEVHNIEFDVNKTDLDGTTAFQEILNNDFLQNKFLLWKLLLLRGYQMTETDLSLARTYCLGNNRKTADVVMCELANRVQDLALRSDVFKHRVLLQIIESARTREFIGCDYQPGKWISFANNVINLHSEYWEYIEDAFKSFGLWDPLRELDKKGSFEKKIQDFYRRMPQQKFDFEPVFMTLYPDVHVDAITVDSLLAVES